MGGAAPKAQAASAAKRAEWMSALAHATTLSPSPPPASTGARDKRVALKDLRTIDVIMRHFYNPEVVKEGHAYDGKGVYYQIKWDEDNPHKSYMDGWTLAAVAHSTKSKNTKNTKEEYAWRQRPFELQHKNTGRRLCS